MSEQSPSVIPNNTTLELIKKFERIREILRFTGADGIVAAKLRIIPASELRKDPVMYAMYNRGMNDYAEGINLVYGPVNVRSVRILFPAERARPVMVIEQTTKFSRSKLSENDSQELRDLIARSNVLLETEGSLALDRIAFVMSLYPFSKIRKDPILFAAYIRGWEDRKTLIRNNLEDDYIL